MKKVILISNKVFHYRVSNYNYFARRFKDEGWELYVRASEIQRNNPYPLEFDFKEMPFRYSDYKQEILRIQPDVVIVFLHLKDLIIWPLLHWLKRQGIPMVYWNKGVNLEVRNPWLRNLPFYYIHSLSDGIILYSEHEVKDIRPRNRHKVWVANNAVNFTAFPDVKESKAEIKAEFGIPFEKVVLFVGRMRPVKKVEHLIQIFNEIEEPGCGCVIVGDQMGYDISAMIQGTNIRFLGELFDPQNIQVSKLFKMADLFVIPGDVGLGMNQAFYWGLPVVTEDGLQPPEIHYLRDGRSGFLVPENDIAALKEKTLLLLKNDALRNEFAQNATEDIHREASVERMFQGFLQCVQTMVIRKPCPFRSSSGGGGILGSQTAQEFNQSIAHPVRRVAERFASWLETHGEKSQDHQDFYASRVGRSAKRLYYKHKLAGTLAVAPMVLCEAFAPWTRRFFFPRMRLPIADAHFAMGFAYLHQATGNPQYLERARHFISVLENTRCERYERHGWGYPFDWQTQGGILAAGTPLITTTPYCYEAFDAVHQIDNDSRWRSVMQSTAEHALLDYTDHETRAGAATCTYTPHGGEKVVNASAYRAGLLVQAFQAFGKSDYLSAAKRNVAFVIDSQNQDGSWPYAMDGRRGFIDHFHTCFVLKGLVKAERVISDAALTSAIEKGVAYYVDHLFDEAGLPKPFAKRPRLTVYRRELYDCAECLNIGLLLRGRFPRLDGVVRSTLLEILQNWVLPAGHFRSRRLLLGWDNVPMHRWGQSEMFRSLTLWLKSL